MALLLLVFLFHYLGVEAFSASSGGGEGASNSLSLFDRFRASCPADIASIRQFEPSLISEEDDNGIWVAVYRSSNNLPSVFMKDDFLNAMHIATSVQGGSEPGSESSSFSVSTSRSSSEKIEVTSQGSGSSSSSGGEDGLPGRNVPVAVARLATSTEFENCFVLDSMRCALKKEDTDPDCDGGSEHAEAIGVCIDELIKYHIVGTKNRFDGALRCKATLVSSKLLEDRGFGEVTDMCGDMASHVSSFDGSMSCYANRLVDTGAKNVGARDRSLQILGLLGPRNEGILAKSDDSSKSNNKDDDDDDYDPWGSATFF
eukprot:scaffold140574_cov48-Attheya_sp.AAC.2